MTLKPLTMDGESVYDFCWNETSTIVAATKLTRFWQLPLNGAHRMHVTAVKHEQPLPTEAGTGMAVTSGREQKGLSSLCLPLQS